MHGNQQIKVVTNSRTWPRPPVVVLVESESRPINRLKPSSNPGPQPVIACKLVRSFGVQKKRERRVFPYRLKPYLVPHIRSAWKS